MSCRLLDLPLVCKRWACILGRPSAVWKNTRIDLYWLHEGDGTGNTGEAPLLDSRVVSAWFSR